MKRLINFDFKSHKLGNCIGLCLIQNNRISIKISVIRVRLAVFCVALVEVYCVPAECTAAWLIGEAPQRAQPIPTFSALMVLDALSDESPTIVHFIMLFYFIAHEMTVTKQKKRGCYKGLNDRLKLQRKQRWHPPTLTFLQTAAPNWGGYDQSGTHPLSVLLANNNY